MKKERIGFWRSVGDAAGQTSVLMMAVNGGVLILASAIRAFAILLLLYRIAVVLF